MSNLRALGFAVGSRAEAEALARAPLRKAQGQLRLLESGAVTVHRLELGAGIELWSVRQDRRIVASYPFFHARETLRADAGELRAGAGPLTPRLDLLRNEQALTAQLVNYLFIPTSGLSAGVSVEAAVAALMPQGFGPAASQPPGVTPCAEGDNTGRIVGRVTAADAFTNPMTGAPLCWLRLDVGRWGEVEAVCPADGAPADPLGQVLAGIGTLRAAVLGIGDGPLSVTE